MESNTERPIWVVKIGSAMITDDGKGVHQPRINHWCSQIVEMQKRGIDVVLVSSGAVAEGMKRLGLEARPRLLSEVQAAASIGQSSLVDAWKRGFQQYEVNVGQILLTHEDAADRKRYLNIKATIETLLSFGAVPVINENDTTSYDEICFGDNDTLGALVANLIDADHYVILTDQLGVFDSDPRHNPDAKLIHEADAFDDRLLGVASSEGGALGKGGMYTKVKAAQVAAKSGTITHIAKGDRENVLLELSSGEQVGTKLNPSKCKVAAKKRWMLSHTHFDGALILDDGAVKALLESQTSLLPIGLTGLRGTFDRGDLVVCEDQKGREIGRGIVNYNHHEVQQILGKNSEEIREILGFVISDEVINRNNWIEKQ